MSFLLPGRCPGIMLYRNVADALCAPEEKKVHARTPEDKKNSSNTGNQAPAPALCLGRSLCLLPAHALAKQLHQHVMDGAARSAKAAKRAIDSNSN